MTAPKSALLSEPSILVGSPTPRVTEFLSQFLGEWRYRVCLAGSGAEAWALLEGSTPPAVAFLDMSLASPSASEMVRSLSLRSEPRQSWIMLMTATPSAESLQRALACGCDDYFPIPADAAELQLRLRIVERVRALMGQLQRQTAELRFQSTHDGLTGLWNREALLSLVFQETDRVQRMKTDLCLMLLDLDGFSRVNHDYGFEVGDRVLARLAHRFRQQLRSYDLIGRSGEDEFLFALPGCSGDSALALAARISASILSRPFAVEEGSVSLTASFGVALSGGRSPVVVLREAERALAEAKLAGKNTARLCLPPGPWSGDLESEPPLVALPASSRRVG